MILIHTNFNIQGITTSGKKKRVLILKGHLGEGIAKELVIFYCHTKWVYECVL